MAIIYFPKGANLGFRNSFNPLYEQLTIATNPNTVFYFDSASSAQGVSASGLFITCSWAQTASVTILFSSNSLSSSYAGTSSRSDTASFAITSSYSGTASFAITSSYSGTASFAINAGTGGSGGSSTASLNPYTTIVSGSGNWITASFDNAEQYILITTGNTYNFTCSNLPTANTASNVSLFVYNTAATTSSLLFPSSWIFIGINPTYLTSSKSGILSLKSFGNGQIVAAWGSQY